MPACPHQHDRQTGEFRLEIARVRRRLDRRAAGWVERGSLVVAPGRYVERHPLRAMLAAVGLGVLAGAWRSRRAARAGVDLADAALTSPWAEILRQCRRLWAAIVGDAPAANNSRQPEEHDGGPNE